MIVPHPGKLESTVKRLDCQIDKHGAGHLHQAVCSACMVPVNADGTSPCWHPQVGTLGWRCIEPVRKA